MARQFINKKGKGTNAERELIHLFWDNEWVCVRVAGSGSSKYPSPDILASNGARKIVLEVKTISVDKKYFTGQEIRDLEYFAGKFGAEAWVGIKFSASQWFFLPTFELEKTDSENYVTDIVRMKRKGFNFDEMINFKL